MWSVDIPAGITSGSVEVVLVVLGGSMRNGVTSIKVIFATSGVGSFGANPNNTVMMEVKVSPIITSVRSNNSLSLIGG